MYENTKHHDKYKDLDMKQKAPEGRGDEKTLGFPTDYVHKGTSQSDAAVIALLWQLQR